MIHTLQGAKPPLLLSEAWPWNDLFPTTSEQHDVSGRGQRHDLDTTFCLQILNYLTYRNGVNGNGFHRKEWRKCISKSVPEMTFCSQLLNRLTNRDRVDGNGSLWKGRKKCNGHFDPGMTFCLQLLNGSAYRNGINGNGSHFKRWENGISSNGWILF